jgi:pre-mRNA-processing factor SLU7
MPPPPPPPRRSDGQTSGAASKEENIYIPAFISKRPFYAGEDTGDETTDYLEHQRAQKKERDDALSKSKWYDRGKKAGPAATKFRKGACENCGAMTHKVKDCLQRPRAKGARWTGRDIQADELVQDVELGWDAKRDRWNGYDPKEYKAVVEEYNQIEELRRQMQAQKAAETGEELAEDGDKYAEESDMSRHQPTSTRQLRLREDTAKYLLNLDLDSAKYDPKTRSMVDAGAISGDKASELFAEEGFLRASGDAAEFENAQRYAWEAQEQTGDTTGHLQANPTAGAFYRKKAKEDAERKRAEKERLLREKYGGGEGSLLEAPREIAVTESEQYVEYDETGLIKGGPRNSAKSKYAEDVFINNHTSVWGSWWNNFKWGYACCHSLLKNSYCTGEDGRRAWEEAERQRTGVNLIEGGEDPADDPGARDGDASKEAVENPSSSPKPQKRTREEMMGGVSEAELDEYRRKRIAANDPMAKFLGKDELVH